MAERDYVLGTHDAEVERLGFQHRLWRPRVLDAWRLGGLVEGQTAIDVGAGPGYASLDLAELVGPRGRVVALERSRRFLDALESRARARGLAHVATREVDLVTDEFGVEAADFAWCRWVLCFVSDPKRVVGRIGAALKSGGIAVFHEYVDYRSWRMMPRVPEQERFVEHVIESWHEEGGDPDIGAALPTLLVGSGFEILSTRLHTDAVAPSDPLWQWPRRYVEVGAERMTALGHMTKAETEALIAAFERIEAEPHARMVLPMVVEVVARRT